MSTTYITNVICGFELKEKEIKDKVTRYDEITGKPYIKEVFLHNAAFIQNIEILNDKDNPDALIPGEEYYGLTIFYSGYDNGNKYLGISLAEVNIYENQISFDFEIPAKIKEFSEKIGIKPKFYLIMSVC